jgi:ATP-dependent Clp protease ATP-binding subunit ClpX
VGGAFVGLESIIERRIGRKTMGFKAEVKARREKDLQRLLEQTQPQDLIKYGLIPEFVGRLPVVATLSELDVKSLVRILTEPKNALAKQYQKIFEFENVSLRFTEDALESIAQQAVERNIGARGLRMIMEELMLEMMFSIPSQSGVKEIVVSKDVVVNRTNPLAVMEKAG